MAAGSVVAPKANFSWAALFMKYFCEGQITSTTLQAKNGEAIIARPEAATTFAGRHRKLIALLLPIALVHAIWWSYMIKTDSFDAFTETDNTGKNGIPRWCVGFHQPSQDVACMCVFHSHRIQWWRREEAVTARILCSFHSEGICP
jgi:hypothetical protein